MTQKIMTKSTAQWMALICLMISFSSCNSGDDVQVVQHPRYSLTWEDDFNGAAGTLPESNKWAFDLGNNNGWGNQELQSYTNLPENISMDGEGNLVITAIRNGNSFTSARIKTQGLFSQQYGRFEARIKTPYGRGIWPAFWLLGDNINSVGWPNCGEIDIMELKGHQPNIMYGSVHAPGNYGGEAISSSYSLVNDRFDNDFHVYAIEWRENQLDFFVDDYLYQRITPDDLTGEWVFDQPFFIIMNVAVGGTYVSFPEPNTPFPQRMTIDYVKVYQ